MPSLVTACAGGICGTISLFFNFVRLAKQCPKTFPKIAAEAKVDRHWPVHFITNFELHN